MGTKMTESQWLMVVRTRTAEISSKSFASAEAAESAAYLAKIAHPEAKVSVHRDSQFGELVWHCGAWYNVVKVERGGAMVKRTGDFATARCEHEFLRKAAACGVTFFTVLPFERWSRDGAA
ncbi:conserved hypothetical protein [Ricinus communis]|uniref:Uncharacterized protein n=1 Tax=Ricinus communis TaxID=3988 RepID=B9TGY3_RICCO|nr:conserved hypothetical protein [Ricinus communis]